MRTNEMVITIIGESYVQSFLIFIFTTAIILMFVSSIFRFRHLFIVIT